MPFFKKKFGNPSSTHLKGREAKEALEHARVQVAAGLGAAAEELIFTSGGSESNNFVLKGLFLHPAAFCTGHLVISAIEHAAISKPARYLEQLGVELSVVPCAPSGQVDPEEVRKVLRPDTRLVSVMHANNEIGTIQPIAELAAAERAAALWESR